MTPLEAQVTDQVRGFESMKLEELRAEWRRRYGAPPKLRSTDLLRRLLGWRVQAEAFGGLDMVFVRQLRSAAKVGARSAGAIRPGARLAREWQGRVHEVDVVDGGFVHLGQRYRSLSAVARAITGVRWNGPRFFGLRDSEAGA